LKLPYPKNSRTAPAFNFHCCSSNEKEKGRLSVTWMEQTKTLGSRILKERVTSLVRWCWENWNNFSITPWSSLTQFRRMNHPANSNPTFFGAKKLPRKAFGFYTAFGISKFIPSVSADVCGKRKWDLSLGISRMPYVKDWVDNTMIFLRVEVTASTWEAVKSGGFLTKFAGVRISEINRIRTGGWILSPWFHLAFLWLLLVSLNHNFLEKRFGFFQKR